MLEGNQRSTIGAQLQAQIQAGFVLEGEEQPGDARVVTRILRAPWEGNYQSAAAVTSCLRPDMNGFSTCFTSTDLRRIPLLLDADFD